MKVLVVSLLRLGDFVMSVPVINGLKASRRDIQIDALTFTHSAGMKTMLPAVQKWWTLNREELQEGLGQGDIPTLTSFAVLQEQLDAINAAKYDLIINLTQSHFSAWVCGYLKSPERLGLTYDTKGVAHFYSPWFRYLNDHAEPGDQDVFHHTDIFLQACALAQQPVNWRMSTSPKAVFDVDALDLNLDPTVVLQIYTSDAKKNLSEDAWISFAAEMKGHQILALGAPAESARLDAFIQRAAGYGVKIKKAILSLEGALELLNRSELLVTGDTSIKHLANAAHCKVLEISLGSSDYRRTGIYKSDSLILQGRATCSPCPHSTPCRQFTHECGLAIHPKAMAEAAELLVIEDWDGLEVLSRRFERIQWLRTRELSTGFWFAQDLTTDSPSQAMGALIERSAWKLALNKEVRNGFIEFGSEGISLRTEIKNIFSSHDSVAAQLDFLEKEAGTAASTAKSKLIELRRDGLQSEDLVQISGLRRRQIALENEFEHSEYKTKLIRTLKLHWRESI